MNTIDGSQRLAFCKYPTKVSAVPAIIRSILRDHGANNVSVWYTNYARCLGWRVCLQDVIESTVTEIGRRSWAGRVKASRHGHDPTMNLGMPGYPIHSMDKYPARLTFGELSKVGEGNPLFCRGAAAFQIGLQGTKSSGVHKVFAAQQPAQHGFAVRQFHKSLRKLIFTQLQWSSPSLLIDYCDHAFVVAKTSNHPLL